jgi:hypothetical protein
MEGSGLYTQLQSGANSFELFEGKSRYCIWKTEKAVEGFTKICYDGRYVESIQDYVQCYEYVLVLAVLNHQFLPQQN